LFNHAGRLAAGLTALLKQKRDSNIPNINQLAALVKNAEDAKTYAKTLLSCKTIIMRGAMVETNDDVNVM
jgi:hypothetical protein